MFQTFTSLRLQVADVAARLLEPVTFRGKGRLLRTLAGSRGKRVTRIFGYEVTLDMSDVIQRDFFLRTYEPEATRMVRQVLRPGMTFVDVGANVGYFTLLASSIVGGSGRVLSFEPNPRPYEFLRATLDRNGIRNVTLLNIGLSDAPSALRLFVPKYEGNETATMIENEGGKPVLVPVETLDEVLDREGIERVDYMKVDVDGFEPNVFAGARRHLAGGSVRTIQSEFCDEWLRRNHSSPQQLYSFLMGFGYRDLHGEPTFFDDCLFDRFLTLPAERGRR